MPWEQKGWGTGICSLGAVQPSCFLLMQLPDKSPVGLSQGSAWTDPVPAASAESNGALPGGKCRAGELSLPLTLPRAFAVFRSPCGVR